MSLRPQTEPLDVEPTDGRSYRRAYHFMRVKRDRDDAARKRPPPSPPPPPPNGGGGGLAGPGEQIAPAPGGGGGPPPPPSNVPTDGQFPLANPRSDQWTISAVRKLWDLLTQGKDSVVSLEVGKWTIGLNKSQLAREALGLPVPNDIVSENSERRRMNRNYALRVFAEASVAGDGGAPTLTLAMLTAYLTRSPNPLGLMRTNDTTAPVHASQLPQMFLKL